MAAAIKTLLLVIALVAGATASVVREEQIARLLPQGRTATVTSLVTVTAATPLTTTVQTTKYCAALATPANSAACRRKRQFWGEAPRFIAIGLDDAELAQFIKPSAVYKMEASALPEFRNVRPFQPYQPHALPPSAYAIRPSFEKTSANVRVASPFFGAYKYSAFSSLFSGIISSLLTPAVTTTSTSTVYTSTNTVLSYTATKTWTLDAACVPTFVTTC